MFVLFLIFKVLNTYFLFLPIAAQTWSFEYV